MLSPNGSPTTRLNARIVRTVSATFVHLGIPEDVVMRDGVYAAEMHAHGASAPCGLHVFDEGAPRARPQPSLTFTVSTIGP